MLTLKSNLFKNKRGQQASIADLQKLAKVLIVDDFANVSGKDSSHGFTYKVAKLIIKKITSNKDAKILILNDITLEMFYALLEAGYKRENIYIAFGKWNKDATVRDDNRLFNIMKNYIRANFEEEINVIELKEIFNMKFNLVIANPPYGTIGAKITNALITELDFDQYINIEPIVDFLKYPNIYNHMQLTDTEIIEGFGGDAHVLPSVTIFNKNINNKLASEEFFICTVSNKLTNKYFNENITNRKSYADISFDENTTVKNLDFTKRLIFGIKICSNAINHLDKNGINVGGTIKSTPYKINKQELTLDEYYKIKNSKAFWGVILTFKTVEERTNAFKFSYSKDGFRFLNLLAHSMQRDNFHAKEYAALFPKVDWTRSWTVEEILKDYGYTEDEIKEVMADLDNFKGMDD